MWSGWGWDPWRAWRGVSVVDVDVGVAVGLCIC